MNAFFVIVRRDLTLALRRASDTISVAFFFFAAACCGNRVEHVARL